MEPEVPKTARPVQKSKEIYVRVVDMQGECHNTIFMDQTGAFPAISSHGNRYLMVLLEYDSSYIMVEAMKNRSAGETVRAYKTLIERQLVPPHDHCHNIAEKAVQVFKSNFVSILCGTDPRFPLHLWCHLLQQAEITLNLLQSSRLVPTVSSYAHVYGHFDYNAHPLAPLGAAMEMNVKPTERESWAPHSTSGWYLGVSMEHYRCSRGWIPDA